MSKDATQNMTDGPSLADCQALIARIDGTMAALARERILLEERAAALGRGRTREQAPDAR